jgi:hypothetical protein
VGAYADAYYCTNRFSYTVDSNEHINHPAVHSGGGMGMGTGVDT